MRLRPAPGLGLVFLGLLSLGVFLARHARDVPPLAPMAPLPVPAPARAGDGARVARVLDGDTLVIEGGDRVRLLGIDAPEKDEPVHDAALAALRELVEGRPVRLEASRLTPRDGYGRLLALVEVEGTLVNEALVERGLARVYFKAEGEMPPETARRLVQAQNRALDARRGLWASSGALTTAPGEALLATRFRFHRATCPKLSGEGARPAPTTREAALRAGKSPCRTCRPRPGGRRAPCNRSRRHTGWSLGARNGPHGRRLDRRRGPPLAAGDGRRGPPGTLQRGRPGGGEGGAPPGQPGWPGPFGDRAPH